MLVLSFVINLDIVLLVLMNSNCTVLDRLYRQLCTSHWCIFCKFFFYFQIIKIYSDFCEECQKLSVRIMLERIVDLHRMFCTSCVSANVTIVGLEEVPQLTSVEEFRNFLWQLFHC